MAENKIKVKTKFKTPKAPNFPNAKTNKTPVISSTKGYLKEIGERQARQRPLSKIKENRGRLSNQAIFFLHFGQNERGRRTEIPRGRR